MKYFIIAAIVTILAGCVSVPTKAPTIAHDGVRITVREDAKLSKDPAVLGLAILDPNTRTCEIVLRKYPQCLAHEVRHCLEGEWHGSRNSDAGC